MTLNEYITHLLMVQKAGYGGNEVWYSIDEEGNGFYPIAYAPSVLKLTGGNEPAYDGDKVEREVVVVN
jgi:hypothetical protein